MMAKKSENPDASDEKLEERSDLKDLKESEPSEHPPIRGRNRQNV